MHTHKNFHKLKAKQMSTYDLRDFQQQGWIPVKNELRLNNASTNLLECLKIIHWPSSMFALILTTLLCWRRFLKELAKNIP